MLVVKRDGHRESVKFDKITARIEKLCYGLEPKHVNPVEVAMKVINGLYDGVTTQELDTLAAEVAATMATKHPDYSRLAARIAISNLHKLTSKSFSSTMKRLYQHVDSKTGQNAPLISKETWKVIHEHAAELDEAIIYDRDFGYDYFGFKTLEKSYLMRLEGKVVERPQHMIMRVAVGIHGDDIPAAIETYNLMSEKWFTHATPTLFNAGTPKPQLSSCFLLTMKDDSIDGIYDTLKQCAKISQSAGGIGLSIHNVRAKGSYIKGTGGTSNGIVPMLRNFDMTARYVDQGGGKRKGSFAIYLEPWHADIFDFLELKKNHGKEEMRARDLFYALWIPDLFMKRVVEGGPWTLFSPDEVPDLHDLYGKAFEQRYKFYEAEAAAGRIKLSRTLEARDLWRKMLTRVFETGHPWITFKDPSNIRSPQDHCGVVHSSNLCTEILLNTSADETAVCNLGSINMLNHVKDGQLDLKKLEETVRTAVRMLDNVIDINFYPTAEARNSNLRHRPVGLGLMGFQDALAACGISYASKAAVEFADRSMEAISYFAILASSELAKERGTYSSYRGSKWDRGLLPIDTVRLLEQERGMSVDMDTSASMDWTPVREHLRQHGMRNSNVMAIAPTATISTIIGVTQSIEPMYKHLFVKSNLSGEFVQLNINLVTELKERGLWCKDLLEAIKYFDGVLGEIPGLPQDIKDRYATSFEIEPKWLIECASRRQKWIDMGQSLNLYLAQPSGRRLDDMYQLAWQAGLKTTYYLRTLGATNVEKSTVDINKFGVQPRWMKNRSASGDVTINRGSDLPASQVKACSLDDPTCEACQ